jgi:GTP-binding protein
VGRPNSGKSTLLNTFLGYDRAVVSDIPGTTRDSIDEDFNFQGRRIRIIDTAGLKKKSRMTDDIEFYSLTRTLDSIKRSDVVIHLIDSVQGLTETDIKISDEIMKARKNTLISLNKWDAVEKDTKTFNEFRDKIIFKFYKAADYPIISISGKNRLRIHKLLSIAIDLYDRSQIHIDTPRLNRALEEIQHSHRLPLLGESLKVFYATQTGSAPPKFKFFVNNAELFRKDIVRFIEKALKEKFGLEGIPVLIEIEGRKKRG